MSVSELEVETPPASPQPAVPTVPDRYLDEQDRLATFDDWPHVQPSAALIAAAGFHYPPESTTFDEVRCSYCGVALSGFTDANVWGILSHDRDCVLKPKLGEAKNRSCGECGETFSSVGAKLNHCKRIHPKPEDQRRPKYVAASGPRKRLRAAGAGPGMKRVAKKRLLGGVGSVSAQRALGDDLFPDTYADTSENQYWGSMHSLESPHGLCISRVMTVVDSEPSVWAGEIVMSRAEYREFRQHFRAMTCIFRDVDPKKRG